jgi:hypothetical protein
MILSPVGGMTLVEMVFSIPLNGYAKFWDVNTTLRVAPERLAPTGMYHPPDAKFGLDG